MNTETRKATITGFVMVATVLVMALICTNVSSCEKFRYAAQGDGQTHYSVSVSVIYDGPKVQLPDTLILK